MTQEHEGKGLHYPFKEAAESHNVPMLFVEWHHRSKVTEVMMLRTRKQSIFLACGENCISEKKHVSHPLQAAYSNTSLCILVLSA